MNILASGCFAAITNNHIQYLAAASIAHPTAGLIVAYASRRVIQKLKGVEAIDDVLRCKMLMALPFVNSVVIQEEETPVKVIYALRPAMWIKGGDYTLEQLAATPEGKAAIDVGAIIAVTKKFPGQSTQEILRCVNGSKH